MSNKELANAILKLVGGENNVNGVTHCVTRLRFNLKDDNKANVKEIEKLDGVIGVQIKGGQFQVIVGSGVKKVYDEFDSKLKNETENGNSSQKGSPISNIFKTISNILIPSLPPIIGGGMIKGFLFMFWHFGMIEWGSDLFNLLNVISDGMFYFYPFLLAVSAAEEFRTNKYMGLAIAGSLMHPTILEGITNGQANLISFGPIGLPNLDYSSSVIPIILSVWLMSYVYRFFEKRIPDIVSVIFTPMLTLLIMIPFSLAFIAPLGFYFGEYLARGIQAIIDFNPIIAGFVVGFLRPLTVFTGTHHAVRAIVSQQLSTYGGTTIGAMNYMSTMAQAAAPLAVYFVLKNENKKMSDISMSSAVSGFLGVTEPAMYGVIMKYKVAFLAVSIGGGVGAAIASYFGAAEYAMVMSSIVTIPATFGEGFMGIAIGLPTSILITMAIIFMFKGKLVEEDRSQRNLDMGQEDFVINYENDEKVIEITSPIEGVLTPLSKISDDAFSSEKIGRGIAIAPREDVVKSPVDGVITAIYPSKHAIGITSDKGVELLIHIGIDTVNLNGEFFEQFVRQGDIVKKEQKLVSFDRKKITDRGYDVHVIVIVLNGDAYLDVVPSIEEKVVRNTDTVLNIII